MGEATIDYDLECYTNQLKYKLENAIYAASNVSDLGNRIGSKLVFLYNSISKLNGKIERTRFYEIVDVVNLKSKELNSCLKMLIRDIPSDIAYSVKIEAKEKSINVSNAKYFKIISIKHINSSKVNENLICDKDVTRPSFASELEHMDDQDYPLSYENLFGIIANKYGQRIYINAKFEDIESSWKNLEERDYKLCVLNERYDEDYSEEDITLYTIHQSFKNKCAEWSIIRENHDIWRLTDAASKIKKPEDKKILCKRDDRIKKKP